MLKFTHPLAMHYLTQAMKKGPYYERDDSELNLLAKCDHEELPFATLKTFCTIESPYENSRSHLADLKKVQQLELDAAVTTEASILPKNYNLTDDNTAQIGITEFGKPHFAYQLQSSQIDQSFLFCGWQIEPGYTLQGTLWLPLSPTADFNTHGTHSEPIIRHEINWAPAIPTHRGLLSPLKRTTKIFSNESPAIICCDLNIAFPIDKLKTGGLELRWPSSCISTPVAQYDWSELHDRDICIYLHNATGDLLKASLDLLQHLSQLPHRKLEIILDTHPIPLPATQLDNQNTPSRYIQITPEQIKTALDRQERNTNVTGVIAYTPTGYISSNAHPAHGHTWITHFLASGKSTLLYGVKGCGKSWLALHALSAITHKEPLLDTFHVEGYAQPLLITEDKLSHITALRLSSISNDAHNHINNYPIEKLTHDDMDGKFSKKLANYLNQSDIIIIDSLSFFSKGSIERAIKFVNLLTEMGKGVLVLHTSKEKHEHKSPQLSRHFDNAIELEEDILHPHRRTLAIKSHLHITKQIAVYEYDKTGALTLINNKEEPRIPSLSHTDEEIKEKKQGIRKDSSLSKHEKKILFHLTINGPSPLSAIKNTASQRTLQNAAKALIEKKRIQKTGKKKGTKYSLASMMIVPPIINQDENTPESQTANARNTESNDDTPCEN